MSDQPDLYGLPLEDFVSARGARAKALRKQGERAQADEIAALRKPSIAAWAVNQLVRTQKREVGALFAAGDELHSAQSQLLKGKGDAQALRDAVAQEREAVELLASKARGLLSADGHELSQTTLDRISETLHAAALDPEARAEVEPGTLQRELHHVGLGEVGGATVPLAPARGRPRRARDKAAATPGPRRSATDKQAEKSEQRAKKESEQRAKKVRAAEDHARRAAGEAQRELDAATARRDEAAESLKQAEAELAAAAKALKQAAAEHRRTQRALDRL